MTAKLRIAVALAVLSAIVASLALAAAEANTVGTPQDKQIAALKKQVSRLKAQVKDLNGQVKFLSGRVAKLQQEVALIPQLAAMAAATARYRELGNALADGYVYAGAPCIPTAGVHYMKGAGPTDDALDPLQPEFLMYAPSGGGLKLVAVEYAVPMRFPRPTFLGNVFDSYTGGPGEAIWYLHVWLWHLNPAGPFSAFNRTVEC